MKTLGTPIKIGSAFKVLCCHSSPCYYSGKPQTQFSLYLFRYYYQLIFVIKKITSQSQDNKTLMPPFHLGNPAVFKPTSMAT